MPTIEELEALSTEELRERAFNHARKHLDVKFFWNLLEAAPAVEAAAGHLEEAQQDILSFSERVADVVRPDTDEEADAFRPIYIEYLLEHGKQD
ncbi:MAG TPA: hypothetical protein VE174_13350 [Actinomycetota bacterium]|nr:hypothetical protein [Actinomycetota bacterium]